MGEASILPAGTTYTFTATINGLAPAVGTGPQTCTVTGVTVAGATQTVNLIELPCAYKCFGRRRYTVYLDVV